MEEDSEYKKLPTDEKCVHKLWKARVMGYEEAAKLFKQIDDDKSPEWNKYLGLIKKMVSDSNAVAQEKGLEAALAFVENCAHAGKTVGEVMSGIVTKCIAAPKTKTKDLSLQVTLMYVEIEKYEAVQEELTKGTEHKNPRIASACVNAITIALRQFGNKVISIKLLVKKIPTLLADRDKDVRTEMKALVVEMHRWIGPALEPHIGQLQPVVLQELRDAFSDAGMKVTPERYLRSQQMARPAASDAQGNDDGGDDQNDDDEDAKDAPDVDPYDLLDPVDILSKLPKDFYEKLEAKKWQERKEALDALETLLKGAPKLEQGDYGDLVRAMKKVISKDSNVMLVALAGRCVYLMAVALKRRFQTYTSALLPCAFDKFKEKKPAVVTSLREAVDAMYACTTIEAIAEDVVEALNNKNPTVKAETAAFLARAIARTQPAALTKKLLKVYVPALLKVLESADPIVRDQAAEALGTATKLVGEKNISPFIGKLDNLKEQKIQECCEKAVILVRVQKEPRPKTAPAAKADSAKAGSAQPKPVKRPTTAGAKKPAAKKAGAPAKANAPSKSQSAKEVMEREMSPDEVDMKAEELLDPSVLTGITDPNWKTRLDAVQSFTGGLPDISQGDGTTQVLLRILNKKPGLKDTNFQVLKLRLEAVRTVAEKFPVSITCVDSILSDIVEKLSDSKCSQAAAEALTALSEATRLDYVACQSLEYALEKQKSPRVQTEIFAWLCSALREFGMVVNSKSVLVYVKKALAATNPAVRTAAVTLIGTMHLFMGASLNQFIDGEKPAIKQQIQLELEKNADEDIPTPIRGMSKSASKGSMDDLEDNTEEDFGSGGSPPPTLDVRPKMDIAPLITEALIQEINDKNWKVRNEALEKVKTIITEAQSIKPGVGELPQALVPRLVDSNSKIAQLALQICEVLVTAIGPKAKVHIRSLFPGIFQGLGDSKTWIRSASLQCINVWTTQCGVPSIFEGEIVFDALKSGSPTLRAELWTWLSEKLPGVTPKAIPREELSVCVPLLYAALEDRGADVRKAAGEAVLGYMMHLGPDSMVKQAEKLKPGSKSVVHAALDKARPNLPVQPLPKSADSKVIKSGGAQAKAQGGQKPGQAKPTKGIVKSASATSARSKGKDDDNESFVPLLPINNIKHQRIIDDQKLKVLKWNFLTPREEFFDLLKDQMTTAGLNKILISNMFHADFRYHIKAIESLIEDLPDNGPALIANLDLVFKWLTLRFFDTNPSVLLRGLEYLNAVFNFLMAENYQMAEYEANCFIPYLVLKVGDPKDTVRNGVKSLLKQICIVYSATKLFGYLMEGLKSKNARQRTECLDVLGLLIESYGVSVCNPSPMAALKEVARQISDRDNSVRNAALNCVVQAYFLEGEKIYKMIGQISDKDHSLLEERIKRAAKGRDTTNRKSMLLPLSASGRPIQPEIKNNTQMEPNPSSNDYDDEEEEQMNDYPPPPMRVHAVSHREQARPVSGPFGLDPGVVAAIEQGLQEDIRLMTKQPQLQEMDLSFLDEPIAAPTIGTVRPVISAIPISPPMRVPMPMSMPMSMGMPMQSSSAIPQTTPPNLLSQPVAPVRYEQDNILSRTIQNIASPNLSMAINALSQMDSILRSNRANLMSPYEEQLLLAIVEQLQIMQRPGHTSNQAESFNAYRFLMSVLVSFYDGKIAGRNVSPSTIGALVDQLLKLLISQPLEKSVADGEDKMVRAVNTVCVKVLDRSDHTALIIALVNLLDKSVAGDPPYPRYQELEMKCLWKVMKMIPSWETDALDYDRLLHRLHLFFKAYPSSYWKRNPQLNDTPFRTVKTLVHTLVKKKDSSIMNHLTQIPDLGESELHSYLLKLFKTLKAEERKAEHAPSAEGSPVKMPRMVQEELSQILKRIGEKEHSKEGLGQLYDLRERHPAVDIWVCLKDASNFFRSYIERGLKEVAEERRSGRGEAPPPLPLSNIPLSAMAMAHNIPSDSEGASSKGPVYYTDRLRALRAKIGMGAESASNSQPRTPIIDNRTLADSIDENGKQNIDPKFDLPSLHPQTARSEPQMDALRQKLQQIKSSNR